MKCPSESVTCLYEEKSNAANLTIVGEAQCLNPDNDVVLRERTTKSNLKGENILNRYKFYGPGVFNKERINYKDRTFKRTIFLKDTYKRKRCVGKCPELEDTYIDI